MNKHRPVFDHPSATGDLGGKLAAASTLIFVMRA